MNSVEARSKGLPWIDFKDIPHLFRHLYDITLACNALAGYVVKQTGEYEMCCEYWFNNTLLKATDNSTSVTTDEWSGLLKGIDEITMPNPFLRCRRCCIEEEVSATQSLFVPKPISDLGLMGPYKDEMLRSNPDGRVWCCKECGDIADLCRVVGE